MAEASPEWKKPSDIMKLRRRKTMGADLTNKTHAARSSPRLSLDGSTTPERKSVKRKNPFARSISAMSEKSSEERICSSLSSPLTPATELLPSDDSNVVLDEENARQRWRQDCLRKALDSDFSGIESTHILRSHPPLDAGINLRNIESSEIGTLVAVHNAASVVPIVSSPQKSSSVLGSRTFPRDWSLKTKVRFVSMSSFSWCTSLRGVDESHGTRAFVAAVQSPHAVDNACTQSVDDVSLRQQEFQQQLMYWVHPNVPWLQTFPRITNSVRQFASQTNNLMQNEDVTKALYNDWCDSMNSAYLMVRSGLCPYLYICCHQMTILFRAAGVVRPQLHAILTPTTRGLRAALDSEGIEYTLPVKRQHSVYNSAGQSTTTDVSPSQQQSCCAAAGAGGTEGDDDDDEDENNADDSAASIWLQDLGLDQKHYRSVDPSKVRDQKDKFRQIDYRPESTVLVEGTAGTQALLNYLLDCSGCFAATGPQAGLPPTMLAPTAFKGATLQSLKVRLGSVLTQSATDGHRLAASSVELSGPLLPHSIAGLTRLLARTSSDRFTATFAVHEPTTSFNATDDERSKPDADSDEAATAMPAANPLSESATLFLASDVVHDSSSELSRGAVREITCENGLFTWTCY